ncbi:MAG: DUF4270 domain-containing protein [Prevotella sp.]|jgi:hypothetical protein|nr:DUF4270 domain-containing protein [Prevotella sp.]
MKIKALLNLAIAVLTVAFVACDDDLNKVGNSIQPGGDDISIAIDTVAITAKTVSLKDSVYAYTEWGLLGNYTDPVFGKVSSDYLCELYCPENTVFPEKTISIDSTFIEVLSDQFIGDSISPFGISAYRLTKSLNANFFTNIKPEKYCDMTKPLGQGMFTVYSTPSTSGLRSYMLRANKSLGQEFYDEWEQSNGATFKNSEALKEFFKGMYVTNSFGSGSLLSVNTTMLRIYFKYTGRNADDTADSIRVGMFRLGFTPEVLQLNHIQNSIPESLFTNSDTRTYLKSPAGVCTELTIPLADIMKKAKETGKSNIKLNAANFKIKGFTEEEENNTLGKSSTLLFINKDSLNNFFLQKKMPDNITSFMMELSSSNVYNFIYGNVRGNVSNNLANMINYYMTYYKDETNIPDLKFLIIPVSAKTQESTSSSGSTMYVYTNIYNQMSPTSAIFRTDKDNMKMSLIFSSYNTQY